MCHTSLIILQFSPFFSSEKSRRDASSGCGRLAIAYCRVCEWEGWLEGVGSTRLAGQGEEFAMRAPSPWK